MRGITKSSLLSVSLISLLSACGGGGEDSSSSIDIPEAPDSAIEGTFKDGTLTGVYYNNERAGQDFGWNGGHCAQNANSHYYETENALIFGEPSLPTSDFEKAAEWVESGFILATELMATSKAEYFTLRDNYSSDVMRRMFSRIEDTVEKQRAFFPSYYIWAEKIAADELDSESYDYAASYILQMVEESQGQMTSRTPEIIPLLPADYLNLSETDRIETLTAAINHIAMQEQEIPLESSALVHIEIPHDFDLWAERNNYVPFEQRDPNIHENYLYKAFKSLSSVQQQEVIAHYLAWETTEGYYDNATLEDALYQQKLYVCLNENASDIGWGEGITLGITFTAPSIYDRKNAAQIIVHELIHTIQKAYSSSPGTFSFLPRWMLEGQAVYLSGQNVAKVSEHANYAPVSVVSFSDEYGDTGEAYEHYGLAYSYLHENNELSSC